MILMEDGGKEKKRKERKRIVEESYRKKGVRD